MNDTKRLFEEIDKMMATWFVTLILFISICALAIGAKVWETQNKVDQLIKMQTTTTTPRVLDYLNISHSFIWHWSK